MSQSPTRHHPTPRGAYPSTARDDGEIEDSGGTQRPESG